MGVYNSFSDMVNQKVKDLKYKNPNWTRLDGQLSKGNREVYAYFMYKDIKWRVNSDTHIEELIKAYELFKKGTDPFIEKKSSFGNTCLVLKDKYANKPKYLYIYKVN